MIWFQRQSKPTYYSQLNGNITIKSSYGQKTLFVDDIPQSGGEYVFMWNKVLKRIYRVHKNISRCVVLGVGGGTVIATLFKLYPAIHIEGIEIDPVMIQLAQNQFRLNHFSNIQIIQADACKWIKAGAGTCYELIIVDLFIRDINPSCTRTSSFLYSLKRILKANGIIVYNSHFQHARELEYAQLQKKAAQLFTNIEEIFSYERNRILLFYN